MKRSSLISQGSLNRLLQAAEEAWKRCDYPSALETLERASRLNPSNTAILLDLGRKQGLRQNYADAERWFEQAVRVSPRKTETLALAGVNSRDFRHPDLAERYLRRAVEQKDAAPEMLAELAEICERRRRNNEAAELVERALHQNPNCAAALLVRARLEHQAGRPEAAEKLLRSLPVSTPPPVLARAGYELGRLLDRQGRYVEAMEAFSKAKALQLPQAGRPAYELKIIRARIHHMTACATADVLQEWSAAGNKLQPAHRLVLLGGHPRSGTTLLEQVLDAHPDAVSAEETEVFYNEAFGPLLQGHPDDTAMFDGLAKATPEALQRSRQNYFRAMESSVGQPVGGRLLIDKNPSYTFLIPGFVRVFPESKLLIALRDPRDVVLSCFMQDIPLNQAGAAFLALESAAAEYGALMGGWLQLKPLLKNPWLEVRYEDMVEDLESVARRTLEFLGLPWDERVLGFDKHARQKIVRSPTYADVTQPVYKRAKGRWHHYRKYLEPHLGKLKPFIEAFEYE
jgi:tetratricopeptide (TPR) repeat protein